MDNSLVAVLEGRSAMFHSVVPFEPAKDRLLSFDFTSNNKELSSGIFDDTRQFTDYLNQKLRLAQAKYGIGGYNEYRELYKRSKVFGSEGATDEPRRLHLGIDIWGKPYTKVMSPLDAVVHSFAFNNNYGDYGATTILSHNLDGQSFHTLYGHLSLNSIKNLSEGGNIKRGDVIGEFGIPMENGQWPPHLHFQIIEDIGEWKGDYPGVCKLSEKEKYLANCPDPDLVLKMMRFANQQIPV